MKRSCRKCLVCFFILMCSRSFCNTTLQEFRALPDNRIAIRTSFGVRHAVAIDPLHIKLVIGQSCTDVAGKAGAYRIVSFTDKNYAYKQFVTPVEATAKKEKETDSVPGASFPDFHYTVVTLTCPYRFKARNEYHVIAQGVAKTMVTGGHTAGSFLYSYINKPKPLSSDVDLAVIGLRNIESVGNGIIMLEMGPGFSTDHATSLELYRVSVNGKPEPVLKMGRLSRVDTYLPIDWPLRVIPMHEVFLQLKSSLNSGDKVRVELGSKLTAGLRTAEFQFDNKHTLSNSIKVNQIGFTIDSPAKTAYLGRWMGSFPEKSDEKLNVENSGKISSALKFKDPPRFVVCDSKTGREVFKGECSLIHTSGSFDEGVYKVDHSGENVYFMDFTSFSTPGSYFISVDGVGRSLPFDIGDSVYKNVFETMAYGVFAQRCGIELKPPCSSWRRIACHCDGIIPSTLSRWSGESHAHKKLPDNIDYSSGQTGNHALRNGKNAMALKAFGGHHDAGDYNPRSHIDVAQKLMNAYEIVPRKFYDKQLSIPEAGNGIPDILDEAMWALRLWMGLQDKDGGVRGGTESNGDPNFIQTVELDTLGDYAFAKDAASNYIFAGAMAQAARIYMKLGVRKQSKLLLSRAESAYKWAEKNKPSDKGDEKLYSDSYCSPKAYAAAQLLNTTGNKKYNEDFLSVCVWSHKADAALEVGGSYDQSEAAWAYIKCNQEKVDPQIYKSVRNAIIRQADLFVQNSSTMAYKFIKHPWAPITWGTGCYQNFLDPLIWAYVLTGDKKYRTWIIHTCNNTLGANPLNRSFVVGLGQRTVRAPLHNSRYSHFGEVVSGMQVQGPHERGKGYRVLETAYPPINAKFASLYSFVDCHFAISMDEGTVNSQAMSMAVFGLLIPDRTKP